jgi:hypothetical protein
VVLIPLGLDEELAMESVSVLTSVYNQCRGRRPPLGLQVGERHNVEEVDNSEVERMSWRLLIASRRVVGTRQMCWLKFPGFSLYMWHYLTGPTTMVWLGASHQGARWGDSIAVNRSIPKYKLRKHCQSIIRHGKEIGLYFPSLVL